MDDKDTTDESINLFDIDRVDGRTTMNNLGSSNAIFTSHLGSQWTLLIELKNNRAVPRNVVPHDAIPRHRIASHQSNAKHSLRPRVFSQF